MKAKGLRFISLITLLAMIFTTFGCDSTQIAADPTSNESIQGEGVSNFCLEIESTDAYNTFIQTSQSLPDNFVTWDMLKGLGTFSSLRVFKNTDFFRYNYDFYIENGGRLQLRVNPYGPYDEDFPPISAANLGDTMATLAFEDQNDRRSSQYENGDLRYMYSDDRLYVLEWFANGNHFVFAGTSQTKLSDLAGYNPDTILGKLLSVDPEVQLAALNELKAAIENN